MPASASPRRCCWSGCGCCRGLRSAAQYGGAATYVAEHAPERKRGFYTSFIQTTATLGLFAALLVVIGVRAAMGEEAFASWGWRLPFLASALLLLVSLWIRLQLNESPVFQKMKDDGTTSKAPLNEAFGNAKNLRLVLVALFGAVAGQAVVWYTGQFYALFFLEKILKVDGATANMLIAARAGDRHAVLRVLRLAERQDRAQADHPERLRAGGALYFPLFGALTEAANPALAACAGARAGDRLSPTRRRCSVQFDPDRQDQRSTAAAATSPSRPGQGRAFPMTGAISGGERPGSAVIERRRSTAGDLATFRRTVIEGGGCRSRAIRPRPIRRGSTPCW